MESNHRQPLKISGRFGESKCSKICADTGFVFLHFSLESFTSEAFVIHWKPKYLKTFSFPVKIIVSKENFGAALLKDGYDYRKELQRCC